MDVVKPLDGETVWVEYPKGKCFRALYDSRTDAFTAEDRAISAASVANWSRQLNEPAKFPAKFKVSSKEYATA